MARSSDETVRLPAPDANRTVNTASVIDVDLAALTHPGRVRPNNEDHYFVARFDRGMRTLATNLPEGEVPQRSAETAYGMMVADGVGGQAAGEVASRTAIAALVDLALETPDWIMRLDDPLAGQVMKRMEGRFQKIHEVLVEKAKADPSLRGMATTLTLACSLGTHLVTAHVGDSRAYRFR